MAAVLAAVYAVLLFQVQAWPIEGGGEQDGRTWNALAAIIFGWPAWPDSGRGPRP